MEATQTSNIEWVNKEVVIYTHKGVHYAATRKAEITQSAETWMELEAIMLSNVSQREEVKYQMFSFLWDHLEQQQTGPQNL